MATPDTDILRGAAAIAAYLGIPRKSVYSMREAGHPAIRNEPGLGLVARRSVLARIATPEPEADHA